MPCWGRPGSSALSKSICSSTTPSGGYLQTSSADSHTPSRLLNSPPQESHGWPSLWIKIWLPSLEVPSTLGTVSCCSSLCLLTGLTALADTGQQGRAGTMCILPSTENPTQCPTLWLVSVYWLKFLAGQIAKPFIFTGVKRKGRKGEEDRRIAGPPKTDQVQRPNRKLSWKWSALHSPAVLSGLETCWGQLAPGNRMQADHQTHLDTGQVTLPHFSLVLSQRENGQI